MAGNFVREIELETINTKLHLSQKLVGDVGCVVWDAAIVLSKYLETKLPKHLCGKNVVELGAGVGCVGLTAACLGADVILTDLPELLPLLENNILANEDTLQKKGGKAIAKTLKWSQDFTNDEKLKPDFILMADCVYYTESLDELISTLNTLCSKETEIIICQEERETETQKQVWSSFLKSFGEIFKYIKVSESEQHPLFHSSDICLIRAFKK